MENCKRPESMARINTKELADALYEILREGDVILFKASRGMALEDVINSLYERIN